MVVVVVVVVAAAAAVVVISVVSRGIVIHAANTSKLIILAIWVFSITTWFTPIQNMTMIMPTVATPSLLCAHR